MAADSRIHAARAHRLRRPARWGGTLAALALVLLASSAFAASPPAEAFRVLPGTPEGPRITPFLRHQLDVAWRHDAARRAAFASVRTEDDLARLEASLREKALVALGGLPAERAPLHPRVVGTIRAEGYRIEKVIFESLPGVHVTALVYLPEGPAAPRPAVLVACGHSPLGKAYEKYQEIAGRLARRGYVVLCWDPVGQGERSQFWDAARGRSRYNLVCGEHAVLGNLATLAGASVARWMVWDGMRAVDYLLTRPEVDPSRLAITGTSGGGFQTLWIGALDERIGVVLPSCFPTSLPMRMANRIFEDPDSDPEQDPFGLVSSGLDHAGLLLLALPRPLHLSAAVLDFFPIEGTRAAFREVEAFYRRFGERERVKLSEGYHKHSYSDANQASAFAFLDRWSGLPVREDLPSVEVLPAEALRCTPSGQVRVDLPGRSLVDVIRESADEARPGTAPWTLEERYHGEGYPGVRTWVVEEGEGTARPDAIAWQALGGTAFGDVVLDRYRLDHSERLTIPLVHVHRKGASGGRVVLDFGLAGKAGSDEWPAIVAHLDAGREVVTFDPRGLGETRMLYRAASIDDPDLAPKSEEEAYASPLSGVLANHVYNDQLDGRPYLFDLVEDVEIVARFARQRLGAREVLVSGRGEAAVVATAAASALDGVEAVAAPGEALGTLDWWRKTLDSGRETWPIHLLLRGGAAVRPGR
jgi:hypothetical protein